MKKASKKRKNGQSFLEYALLVVIALLAVLAANFLLNARNNAFDSHFNRAKDMITGFQY
jgi:uncharacterized protein (UPF0333 family)